MLRCNSRAGIVAPKAAEAAFRLNRNEDDGFKFSGQSRLGVIELTTNSSTSESDRLSSRVFGCREFREMSLTSCVSDPSDN